MQKTCACDVSIGDNKSSECCANASNTLRGRSPKGPRPLQLRPLGDTPPLSPVAAESPGRRAAMRLETSENGHDSPFLLLPMKHLTRTLETELFRDHPECRSYFEAVQRELPAQAYQKFLAAFLDWWTGTLHTSHLLDRLRMQTASFVRRASRLLSPKSSMLEDLSPLLWLRAPSSLHLCVIGSEVAFVILEVAKHSQVFAISPEANTIAYDIHDTDSLRAVLALPDALQKLLEVDLIWAPCVMQLLQVELDDAASDEYKKMCLKYLRKLAKKFRVLPPSLFLSRIERSGFNPIRGGGFADIWKGSYSGQIGVQDTWTENDSDQTLCLKVLRMFIEGDEQTRRKLISDFCHEALIWKQLHHPHVLPFLGVNTDIFAPAFCLVSPWMSNGDIMSYLKDHPDHNKLAAITEVVHGMNYLHSLQPPIVHGDIRGANILVTKDGTCCLADFGLALVVESQVIATTTSALRGSLRWLAPELINPSKSPNANICSDKRPRDTYAFACTILEIISGQIPFAHIRVDAAVIFDVVGGIRPPRPQDVWCPDYIWTLVEKCWAQEPTHRPTSKHILNIILEGQSPPRLQQGTVVPLTLSSRLVHSPRSPDEIFSPSTPADPTENVMWVENVPQDAPSHELWAFFNKFGDELRPSSMSVRVDRNCAFVKYDTELKLMKAKSTFNGQWLRPSNPPGPSLKCHDLLLEDDARRYGYRSADGRQTLKALMRSRRSVQVNPGSRDGYTSSPAPVPPAVPCLRHSKSAPSLLVATKQIS